MPWTRARKDLAVRIRDVGFLPEGELHSRSEGSSPYDMGRDDTRYPMRRVFDMAELASRMQPEALPALRTRPSVWSPAGLQTR